MKAVIPAKASSIRVPQKNFRPFAKGKSLLDLTIERTSRAVGKENVFVSSEDESKRKHVESFGVNFLPREPRLCDNDLDFHSFFNGICNDVPGDDDIAWCQVIDPLFDEHEKCIQKWEEIKARHDSLTVVYPVRKYLLDDRKNPIGFGFGPWHRKSQDLPVHYELHFTMAILPRKTIKDIGYYVGRKPYWYEASNPHVDIDTETDFLLAGKLYELMNP